MSPCPENEFFDTIHDPRYFQMEGGFSITSANFEEENGMTHMWDNRYSNDEADVSLIKQLRIRETLYPYSRPTIGWAMECELDSSKMTRE